MEKEITKETLKDYTDTQTRLKLSEKRVEELTPVVKGVSGILARMRELDIPDVEPMTVFRNKEGR